MSGEGSAAPGRGPVIFFGTAAFAVPTLRALAEAGEGPAVVVTQPDRPRGRGRHLEPSPVKHAAQELGLTVFQPGSVNDPEALSRLGEPRSEFHVVVAYGQLLGRGVLNLPVRGAVNLHPSLLPRHRGPAPVAWSILSGDPQAGNSTMFLDEGMDTGPVLLQEAIPLPREVTRGELEAELSLSGAQLVVRTLRGLRSGAITPKPQDPSQATVSRLITRPMRCVDWTRSAAEVRRVVHAFSPQPAAVTRLGGRLVKVLRVRDVPNPGCAGRVVAIDPAGPVVGCGEGALVLLEVQPEGKRAMSGEAFARGGGAKIGDLCSRAWPDG